MVFDEIVNVPWMKSAWSTQKLKKLNLQIEAKERKSDNFDALPNTNEQHAILRLWVPTPTMCLGCSRLSQRQICEFDGVGNKTQMGGFSHNLRMWEFQPSCL